jgi:hypothetical protein
MTVFFEITTANGSIHTGAVAAPGGFLGGGAAHMGPAEERRVAINMLERMINFTTRTGDLPPGLRQNQVGMCRLHPQKHFYDDCDTSDKVEYVPLSGAKFRLAEPNPDWSYASLVKEPVQ